MTPPVLDVQLCRKVAASARENVSLVRQVLGVGGEELAAQLEIALGEASRMRAVALVAIERGVDTALGEVSRQQGSIALNVGAEARGDGIRYARSLLLSAWPAEPSPEPGPLPEIAVDEKYLRGWSSDQMIRKFGEYHDLCDEDLEYLLHHVASDTGFLRPLIREIRRRRAESGQGRLMR